MSKFESNVKQIAYPQQNVYNMLSDLTNIERVKAQIPDDKLKDLTFDKDTISISVSPIGQISMRIIERDEPKTIKFAKGMVAGPLQEKKKKIADALAMIPYNV